MQHVKEEQISAFIDNQLDAGEKLELEMHLRDCPHCRAFLEEMRGVNCLFQEAERVAPSPFLWNRIAARIGSEETTSKHGWRYSILGLLRAHSRSIGMAAAALVVFLAVGITGIHLHARRTAEQAALSIIDQTHKSLAALDPDFYNPFSSGFLGDLESNPFRTLRLSGKTPTGE